MSEAGSIGGGGLLFFGEDKTFRLECLDVNGNPQDMSGWTVKLTIRATEDATGTPLFQGTASITGTYNSVRAKNTQRAAVTVDDNDLDVLLAAKQTKYSMRRTDAGSRAVLRYGDFIIAQAVGA